AMKSEASAVVGGGRSRAWFRSGLVMLQVSLSFLLLVGAGLLMKSMQAMGGAEVGFATEEVLLGNVDLVSAGYDAARLRNFQDQLRQGLETIPGVESIVWVRWAPFRVRGTTSAAINVEGFETAPGEQPVVEYNEVGPNYFATTGIPLLSGRDISAADTEATV